MFRYQIRINQQILRKCQACACTPTPISTRLRYFSVKRTDEFNYNRPEFELEGNDAHEAEIASYPRVTAEELASNKMMQKGVKMLVRDFIQDSLYNPNYGYFSKRAEIFSPVEPIKFNDITENGEFDAIVSRLYREHDQQADPRDTVGRQVWHTPTELFKPYYGYAIAQCIVSEYLLRYFPYEDLVIYELGGGNGTFALNFLDFLKRDYPDVYDRTQYHIVEISTQLANRQRRLISPRHPTIQITNSDILSWKTQVPMPCYVLAMEVVDNFPHDAIRYSTRTLKPYQGLIAITTDGAMQDVWEPANDPTILRFLKYQSLTKRGEGPRGSSRFSPTYNQLRRFLPLAPNLTTPEYLPTKLMTLLELLAKHFPLHRLLLSDFSSLPDTIKGYDAPVVQTRLKDTMVACETLAVQPGYFDIFFPTDFEFLRDMYEIVLSRPVSFTTRSSPLSTISSSLRLGADFFSSNASSNAPKDRRRNPLDGMTSSNGLPVGQRQSFVYSHREFMEKYADLDALTLRSGGNPMLDFYQNVKFLF